MGRFSKWLIHKLGGYTEGEYTEMRAKHDAIKNAHEQTLKWFQQPVVRVDSKAGKLAVNMVVALEDRVPVEYLKQHMCSQMADRLFSDGLVSFDVEDDRITGGKLYRGIVEVIHPVGFGAR